jgi:peptidoglycan/LPS O-acetylase OafA/YrhL
MTGRNRLDRQIGALSYPFYLGHFLVITVVDQFAARFGGVVFRALVALIISASIAYLTVVLFDAPIDRYRQWRVERSRLRTATS